MVQQRLKITKRKKKQSPPSLSIVPPLELDIRHASYIRVYMTVKTNRVPFQTISNVLPSIRDHKAALHIIYTYCTPYAFVINERSFLSSDVCPIPLHIYAACHCVLKILMLGNHFTLISPLRVLYGILQSAGYQFRINNPIWIVRRSAVTHIHLYINPYKYTTKYYKGPKRRYSG